MHVPVPPAYAAALKTIALAVAIGRTVVALERARTAESPLDVLQLTANLVNCALEWSRRREMVGASLGDLVEDARQYCRAAAVDVDSAVLDDPRFAAWLDAGRAL